MLLSSYSDQTRCLLTLGMGLLATGLLLIVCAWLWVFVLFSLLLSPFLSSLLHSPPLPPSSALAPAPPLPRSLALFIFISISIYFFLLLRVQKWVRSGGHTSER